MQGLQIGLLHGVTAFPCFDRCSDIRPKTLDRARGFQTPFYHIARVLDFHVMRGPSIPVLEKRFLAPSDPTDLMDRSRDSHSHQKAKADSNRAAHGPFPRPGKRFPSRGCNAPTQPIKKPMAQKQSQTEAEKGGPDCTPIP